MSEVGEISPAELARELGEKMPWTVLDVRELFELQTAAVDGVVHIPLSELVARAEELPKEGRLAVLCHSGMRSLQAARYLSTIGFDDVHNVAGGIDQWSITVDSSIPRY